MLWMLFRFNLHFQCILCKQNTIAQASLYRNRIRRQLYAKSIESFEKLNADAGQVFSTQLERKIETLAMDIAKMSDEVVDEAMKDLLINAEVDTLNSVTVKTSYLQKMYGLIHDTISLNNKIHQLIEENRPGYVTKIN